MKASFTLFPAKQSDFGPKLVVTVSWICRFGKLIERWEKAGFELYVIDTSGLSKHLIWLCHLRTIGRIHAEWILLSGNSNSPASW